MGYRIKPKFHNHLSRAFDKNAHANNAVRPKNVSDYETSWGKHIYLIFEVGKCILKKPIIVDL